MMKKSPENFAGLKMLRNFASAKGKRTLPDAREN